MVMLFLNEKLTNLDPNSIIRVYCQSVATINLLIAFASGSYAATQRLLQ